MSTVEIRELRDHVMDVANELDQLDPSALDLIIRCIRQPPKGGSAGLIAGICTQTANVALTTTAANLFPANGNPLVLNSPQPQPAPGFVWGIAFAYVQQVTGVSAGASITVAISTTAQVGQALEINQGAGSATVATNMALGLVSGNATTVSATGVTSSGTGTVTNSATAPSVLGVLSML